MAFYAYLRVSTKEQAKSGLGLEAQLSSCRRYVEDQGGELPQHHIFVERDVSGDTPVEKCPQLTLAMNALKRGDVLVVAKRDRLGRGMMKTLLLDKQVEKIGARIISAIGEGTEDDSPESLLLRRMMDMIADFELNRIRARSREAIAAKKARGERWCKRIPYGFELCKDGLHIQECPEEQLMISIANKMRNKGVSWRKIIKEFNRRGMHNRTGPWVVSSAYRCLSKK